jgi:hypothetical protein
MPGPYPQVWYWSTEKRQKKGKKSVDEMCRKCNAGSNNTGRRMKRTLLLASLTVISTTVFAALPFYEPFADATGSGGTSYTLGDPVPGQNNGSGGVTWSAAGPTGVTNTIASDNLSINGMDPSKGGSMQFGVSTGPSARMNLGTTITAGSLFYSFAFKVTDLGTLGTSGGFVAGFNNAAGDQPGTPTVVTTALMMRSITGDAGGFNLGVRKGTGTPAWSPTAFHLNDVIFVVGSYTFLTGSTTDDVASMWLNPAPSTYGLASAPSTTLNHTGVADVNSPGIASLVFWRRGNGNLTLEPAIMFADEIKVGTIWAEVTPEPSSAALAIAGGFVFLAVRRFRSRA